MRDYQLHELKNDILLPLKGIHRNNRLQSSQLYLDQIPKV